MANKPETLISGVLTPKGLVTFAAVDNEHPLMKMTKKDSNELISPHNKMVLKVDDTTAEFEDFMDKIEEFGINKSVSVLIENKKRVKGFKRITGKTFSVGEHSTLAVVMSDGTPVTDKYFDTRVDNIEAQMVLKVIKYTSHDTLALEIEAVIIHKLEKGEREVSGNLSDAARLVVEGLKL